MSDAPTHDAPTHATEFLLGDSMASDLVKQGVDWLQSIAEGWGANPMVAEIFSAVVTAGLTLTLCWIANFITKGMIRGLAYGRLRKLNKPWSIALIEHHVLLRLSHLVPVLFLAITLPAFEQYGVQWWLRPILEIYVIWILLRVIFGLIEVGEVVIAEQDPSGKIPTTGISQALKVILTLVAFVLVLSVLFTKSPFWFISGLGALTAVLLLIFRDSILGLVAGIQVSVNDMVRVGDWITIPNKNVDGDVEEITLTTIRVRAFDKTISLIPAYDLISNPFTNWRGMSESGGRRIKRSLSIDMSTVRFIDRTDLDRYRKFTLLAPYLDQKIAEIDEWNKQESVDTSQQINGRQQTNVGVFRAYMEAYLRQHPKIHTEANFTFLIRHLQPGSEGLPIEIYVFTNDNRWVPYEEIQADIIDHLIAAVPEFDLSIFQSPSGLDIRSLSRTRYAPHDE